MAKLPYTFTIVPPNDPPEPKFTASCGEIGRLLMSSPNGDLTINQKQMSLWDSWTHSVCHKPVELKYQEWREQRIKEKNGEAI
jgi:hypothetical protein